METHSGVSTKELDDIAGRLIKGNSLEPAFLGYRGYPANICVSINSEIIHGIPDEKKILKLGDIVSIDLGVIYQGFYGDMAITIPIGKVSQEAEKLIRVTRDALYKSIEKAVEDNQIGDMSWAIQTLVEDAGFSVIRDYSGHGIGRELHEEPQIPNFGNPHKGLYLKEGMVLAVETMVCAGNYETKVLEDGWTTVTSDGSLSAHFEHMVLVKKDKAEILTVFK